MTYSVLLTSIVTGLYLMYTHPWSQQSILKRLRMGEDTGEGTQSLIECAMKRFAYTSATSQLRTSVNTTERPKTSRETRLRPLRTYRAIMTQVPITLVET